MQANFWQGKKVLITGHTGFKGSWLTIWLKKMGAIITGYALPPEINPNIFDLANAGNEVTSINGDILDIAHMTRVFSQSAPEIVFHLAAQPLVLSSYHNPIETYQVNVIGTANVLQIVRQISSVRVVIVVTSDKCYENREWIWGYRENDPMGGYDPYSSSKGCAELVVASYRQSFFNPEDYEKHGVSIASVRAGNVVGGGDLMPSRLVPDLIRAFMRKEEALLRHPHAHRPWQYILDLLNGYLLLAEKMWDKPKEFTGAWNFGPNEENVKSVAWIADKLKSLWDKKVTWTTSSHNNYHHEATCLKLDSNKSRSLLKWLPKLSIDAVLEETCDWYKALHLGKNMVDFTKHQITAYEAI